MIAIMLDTNVIHRDAWLTSEPGQKLLQLAKDNRCKILYPQVVRDELHRQHSERARAAHSQALDGITGLESAGINVKQITTDLDSVLQQVDLDLEASFLELLESPNVVSAPVPKVDVTELLKRDLQRRRPGWGPV